MSGEIDGLAAFVASHPRLFVLTGAGVSTASGIPDYRDLRGAWKRPRPVQHAEFVREPGVRRRYWARSFVGWPRISSARPSRAHHALARLEERGRVQRLVTQNVDGLHQSAGSRAVIDLHGRLDSVECLGCKARRSRCEMQRQLRAANPEFAPENVAFAPDGDADLESADFDGFDVPDCDRCGGILKPAVVFFGDSVPRDTVDRAFEALDHSDAVLVVGSSLMVWSGYRFCRTAREQGKPVAAVNLGRTRADAELDLKIEQDCGAVLEAVAARFRDGSPGRRRLKDGDRTLE
jgi:NAD-dependent SIR2 family protein deacetylase